MAKTSKKYTVTFKFNGATVTKKTDDVAVAIEEVKPKQLHTEMYVTVKNGNQLVERRLLLIPAKRVFSDAFHRQVFINNLLLQ
ncbi:MAG: hypothetical protein CO041_05950 [Candidatus Pacebacteria bacterium CG_4_9_14_0_2_um_filter_40_15]|nr:MAG: hypothetical protein CO041_05950 [Candidatus Pacebacteria bacterium CG_4_9_14_0_2_um_filter_40_15]